ncbi:Minichromosome loss protein Mcl1 middle region [Trinorchestia longiramus]|nr:Minichromosome loss protein Mcl1 middle region [Trinorchestia longiramus]
MSGDLRPTRYAHCEGHTDVCFSDDGRSLITCGEDGEVRVFQGLDDDDCLTHIVGDRAHALSYKFPDIVVGCDYNCIQYFNAETGNPGSIIARFTSHPTCLDVHEHLIAAGGSDMIVCVHNTTDSTDTVLEGHTSSILSVSLDPKGDYVASSSCDGSVKIWFLASNSCVKTLPDLHPRSNRFAASTTLCRMAFTPSGSHLLVPTAQKVDVYSRETWLLERHLKLDDAQDLLSIVTVSKCGGLVGAATTTGVIAVFDFKTGSRLFSAQHPKKVAITALVWNPDIKTKKELAFTDCQGQLGTLTNITSSIKAGPRDHVADQSNVFPPPEVDAALDDIMDQINGTDDEGDMLHGAEEENDISLAKIKSQMGFADDEHGTFIGLPTQEENAPPTRSSSPPPPAPVAPASVPQLQRCFTPSMTPEHHAQRYMVWNSVGIVKQYNLEEDCSIGVEFHDSSLHHSLHLPNSHSGYSIAALSHQALVLAAEASADSPSRVWVQLLLASSAVGSQDWNVELPDGEDCIAVTCSNKIVCIASDKRIVRVHSIGGMSLDVLCVPGALVCMASHEHHLMLLYHAATAGSDGDQQMQMMVLNTERPSSRDQIVTHKASLGISVALCPRSFVSWAGFSDEGTPVVVDSAGFVRMLHSRYRHTWTIILSTKALVLGHSDHHFVLGVSESEGKVRSVLCRGSRYPPLVPPPYVSLNDFKVPLLDAASEKGELEASLLQYDLQANSLLDKQDQLEEAEILLQTTLIKLFALACRSGREVRALDVCRLMSERSLQSAIKYSAKLGRSLLAESINGLYEQRRTCASQRSVRSQHVIHDSYLEDTSTAVNESSVMDESSTFVSSIASEGDSIVEPTPCNIGNPLLAVATRRSRHDISLDSTISASVANPFRKVVAGVAAQAEPRAGKKAFDSLDDYRHVEPSTNPIRRPVLRKKGKAERKPTETNKKELLQSVLSSKFTQSISGSGKENQSSEIQLVEEKEETRIINETKDSTGLRGSPMFKSTSAMYLWWADNEHLVEEQLSGPCDFRKLIPIAALLFKDLPNEVKEKYKKMANDNSTKIEGITLVSSKRKRPDPSDDSLPNQEPKKLKPSSAVDKLAAFAFKSAS